MDRPSSSANSFLLPPNYDSEKNITNNKFDKLFKPIVDNIDENYAFNQYQYGKGTDDIQKRMDGLMNERDHETMLPGRPRTPDFLKPMKTKQDSFNEMKQSNMGDNNMPSRRGGKPDFSKEIPKNELNSFKSLNEDETELYNINNIDKPIDIKDVREDSRSFSERLKTLQNDRGNVNIPQNRGRVDFTSDNFQSTFESNVPLNDRNKELEEIPDYEPKTIEQIRKEKEDAFIAKKMAINNTVDEDSLKMKQFQQMNKQQQLEQMQKQHQLEQMKKQHQLEQMQKYQLEQMQKHQSEQKQLEQNPQLQKLKDMEDESVSQQLRQLKQLQQLQQLEQLKKQNQPKEITSNKPEVTKMLSANKNIDVKKFKIH